MSFVMIRGSIPIYWSQPGIRYRPPPKLDRSKFSLVLRSIFDQIVVQCEKKEIEFCALIERITSGFVSSVHSSFFNSIDRSIQREFRH